ncbi:mycothiol transferase [Streptomyces sp. NPDC002577]
MNSTDVLRDGYGRIQEAVHAAVEGLSAEELTARIDPGANSIAWLVWHLTRVQDDHISDVAGLEQVWVSQDWAGRFELPYAKRATGFGHSSRQVGKMKVDSDELLLGYYDAVHEQTLDFLNGLEDGDLDRIVDESWTPPVSLGVRLVSVIEDDLQHAGQAAFVRGVLERRQED